MTGEKLLSIVIGRLIIFIPLCLKIQSGNLESRQAGVEVAWWQGGRK